MPTDLVCRSSWSSCTGRVRVCGVYAARFREIDAIVARGRPREGPLPRAVACAGSVGSAENRVGGPSDVRLSTYETRSSHRTPRRVRRCVTSNRSVTASGAGRQGWEPTRRHRPAAAGSTPPRTGRPTCVGAAASGPVRRPGDESWTTAARSARPARSRSKGHRSERSTGSPRARPRRNGRRSGGGQQRRPPSSRIADRVAAGGTGAGVIQPAAIPPLFTSRSPAPLPCHHGGSAARQAVALSAERASSARTGFALGRCLGLHPA
jgi:hypothetical protein